jgi:hypothetical protein
VIVNARESTHGVAVFTGLTSSNRVTTRRTVPMLFDDTQPNLPLTRCRDERASAADDITGDRRRGASSRTVLQCRTRRGRNVAMMG